MLYDALFAAIIAFSGIIAGMLLAFFAKEEVKSGRKYLALLQKALILIFAVIIVNFFQIGLFYRAIIYLVLMLIIVFTDLKSEMLYPVFGVFLYLTLQNDEIFLFASSLIFLIGLPTGSLAVKNYKVREIFIIALKHSPMLLAFAALVLLSGKSNF